MIDYIKLKIAHELACKYSKETNLLCSVDVCFNGENITYHLYYGASEESHLADYHYTYSIEDLITKLKELTQPKPKYEIGQEVYWIVSDVIYSGIIDCANPNENRWKIKIDDELVEIDECYLYPSKEALIDAQIEYWKSLKQDEVVPVEESQESKICPDCGSYLDAYGVCWQTGCSYIKPIKPEDMRPKFEGEVKGFNHCEHEYDALRDDARFRYLRMINGCDYYISRYKFNNEIYCSCGLPADVPHTCKCSKCGEEKKLRCECGALADYLHICSYSTDSNSNKDSCDHIYAGGGSGHDLSQMSIKCSKCGKNLGSVIHKANQACKHETEQGGCGGDLMFKCKKCGEFYR